MQVKTGTVYLPRKEDLKVGKIFSISVPVGSKILYFDNEKRGFLICYNEAEEQNESFQFVILSLSPGQETFELSDKQKLDYISNYNGEVLFRIIQKE